MIFPLDFSISTVLPFCRSSEHFPMSNINEAFARLESGKARYRIVLDADF
jgi:D-arabinose 1-dehydrogenase-like Zn-dependent alcohol dehydrogenase